MLNADITPVENQAGPQAPATDSTTINTVRQELSNLNAGYFTLLKNNLNVLTQKDFVMPEVYKQMAIQNLILYAGVPAIVIFGLIKFKVFK